MRPTDDGGTMSHDDVSGLTAYDYSRDLEAVTHNDDGTTTYHYEGGLKLTLKSDEELDQIEARKRYEAAMRPAWEDADIPEHPNPRQKERERRWAQREAEERVRNARSWPKPVDSTVDALDRKWEVFDPRDHERGSHSIFPPHSPQYVYMIRCYTRVKIGRTRNPKHRLQTLRTSMPYEVELLALGEFSDASGRESFFHTLLKEGGKHRKGEWFELDDEDIHHLTNMINRGDTKRPLIDSLRMVELGRTDNGQ